MKTRARLHRILVVFLLISSAGLAATPEDLQFEKLKEERIRTPAGTSQMADQRYRTSLEELLRNPRVATQPELMRQIQAELQAAAGAKAATSAAATPLPIGGAAASSRTVTKNELKKLFEDSVWKFVGPGSGNPAKTFTFTKDGKVAVSRIGDHWERFHFWEVATPDVLKLFSVNPDKNRKATFRAFWIDFESKRARIDASLGGEPAPEAVIQYVEPLDRKK